MILTRSTNPNLLPLYFENTLLKPTSNHKHLGVILQDDCKWDEHINSIVTKCRPLVNCLRTYKYRLSRQALENLYKSYILPHFDYADVLWDNCTQTQAEDLESLHLDALRSIIGSVRGTSHAKIYLESGFIPLHERRKRHKLIMYHKIVNKHVPNYLQQALPPLVSENNTYSRRRPFEREILAWDICRFRDSFFLNTSSIWNNLPHYIQSSESIGQLKRFLSKDDPVTPPYYYTGNRTEQLIHCKLRLKMSDLNQDKVNRHISNDPLCACSPTPETAKHYLLHCPLHERTRTQTISTLPPAHQNINTLLNGNSRLSNDSNETVFISVQNFIKESNRFLS